MGLEWRSAVQDAYNNNNRSESYTPYKGDFQPYSQKEISLQGEQTQKAGATAQQARGQSQANYQLMGQQLGSLGQAVQRADAAANGDAPSVAANQQRAGLDSAIQAQMAAANSGPGGYSPAAAVAGAQQGALMQRQAVNDAAQLRAAEMAQGRQDALMARRAVGEQLGANQNASFNQQQIDQTALGRSQAFGMQMRGMNQDATNAFEGFVSADNAAANNFKLGLAGQAAAASEAQKNRDQAFYGGLMSAGGALLSSAVSDERTKTNIDNATEEQLLERLRKLNPKAYDYKPSARAAFPDETTDGRNYGVMAQDLERRGFTGMVSEDPRSGTKKVDTGQAAMTALAGVSALAKKLDAAERRDYAGEWRGQLAPAQQRKDSADLDKLLARDYASEWQAQLPRYPGGAYGR
jgi:hypothetical protein